MTKTEGEEEHVCSSFFQSLSEASPWAIILFCLTLHSRGHTASFCIAHFSNSAPISESWRKERAEEGERIKWQRACKRAFGWQGGRVSTTVDSPHHPKADAHGVEETMVSHSRWWAAGTGLGYAAGGTLLWVCAPTYSRLMPGISRVSQVPGHRMAGKVVVRAMQTLGSKATITGIDICFLSLSGNTSLHPSPPVPNGHRHTAPASRGKCRNRVVHLHRAHRKPVTGSL